MNVVYAIVYARCSFTVYVGESERELREKDVRAPQRCTFKERNANGRAEIQMRVRLWIKKLATVRPARWSVKDITIRVTIWQNKVKVWERLCNGIISCEDCPGEISS